jgi:hypothetical protein
MTRRTAPLIAFALMVALALAGCGPINAASGAQDAFTQHMQGQPGVAEVAASGSNNLPFTGSVKVTVTLDQGSDTATLTAVIDRMASFVADYPYNVTWMMRAALDGYTMAVVTSEAANAEMIALFESVRSTDGVLGGSLGDSSTLSIAVATDAVDVLERLLALDFTGPVTVLTDDGVIKITSTENGALPAAEIAAVDAVAAQYTILTAVIQPGSVTLRLQTDPDVIGASALVKTLPGAGAIAFAITGGIVTREGEGSFALVNPIIEQATALPDVVAISAEPDVLGFTVTTTDAVAALEQLLATSSSADSITVYYRSADDQEPGFSLYGPPSRRAVYLPVVAALVSSGYVSRVNVFADRIDVVAGAYDEARMDQLAAELKSLLPDNTDTRLTNTSGGVNFSFVSGSSISVDSDESYGDVDAQGFVDAWNAAP